MQSKKCFKILLIAAVATKILSSAKILRWLYPRYFPYSAMHVKQNALQRQADLTDSGSTVDRNLIFLFFQEI